MLVRLIVAIAMGLVVALAGCAGCEQVTIPPQDGNESRATAVVLPLDQERIGAVHCIRTRQGQWAGDCVDWYRVEATRAERIVVEMRLRGTPASEPAYPLALELWSADGKRLDRAVTDATERTEIAFEPQAPVSYEAPRIQYVAVKTIDPMTRPQGYRLRAVQDAAPPPPPKPKPKPKAKPRPKPRPKAKPRPKPAPVFDTRTNIGILEVERGASGGTVLIEFRGGDGAEKGQRGRLVSGGRRIVDIQIIEVYAEGSRARLLGEPSEVITGATRAEIDVPR